MSTSSGLTLNIDTSFAEDFDTLGNMSAEEIEAEIERQCPIADLTDTVANDGTITFSAGDKKRLRSNVIVWILERRMSMENDKLGKDNEIIDITNKSLDALDSLVNNLGDLFTSSGNLASGSYHHLSNGLHDGFTYLTGIGFALRRELGDDTVKDIENKLKIIKDKIEEVGKKADFADQEVSLTAFANAEANESFLDFKEFDQSVGGTSIYQFTVTCKIDKLPNIIIPYDSSHFFHSKRDAILAALLQLRSKLQMLLDEKKLASWKNFGTLAGSLVKLGQSATSLAKSVQDHVRNEDIRGFRRAADYAGPTTIIPGRPYV